jgi:DNA-binding transcriptional regulator YdaS (Cro superfamily)
MRHSRVPSFRALVAEAVRIVGSQTALATELGKSQQLISFLCTHATEISAGDAIGIHRATGGKVAGSMLRPDLWRRPEDVPVEHTAEGEKGNDTQRIKSNQPVDVTAHRARTRSEPLRNR